jgi:hypothetical protein
MKTLILISAVIAFLAVASSANAQKTAIKLTEHLYEECLDAQRVLRESKYAPEWAVRGLHECCILHRVALCNECYAESIFCGEFHLS